MIVALPGLFSYLFLNKFELLKYDCFLYQGHILVITKLVYQTENTSYDVSQKTLNIGRSIIRFSGKKSRLGSQICSSS